MPAITIAVNRDEPWTFFLDARQIDQVQLSRLGSELSKGGWRAHGPMAGRSPGYPWRLIVRQPWRVEGEAEEELERVVRMKAAMLGLGAAVKVSSEGSGAPIPDERDQPGKGEGAAAAAAVAVPEVEPVPAPGDGRGPRPAHADGEADRDGGATDDEADHDGASTGDGADRDAANADGEAERDAANAGDGAAHDAAGAGVEPGDTPTPAGERSEASEDTAEAEPARPGVPDETPSREDRVDWMAAASEEIMSIRDELMTAHAPAGGDGGGDDRGSQPEDGSGTDTGAALRRMHETEDRLRKMHTDLKGLLAVQKALLGMLLMDKPGLENSNEAYRLLKEVEPGFFHKDRRNDVIVFLARMDLDQGEPEEALEYLNFAGTRGNKEIEALRGRAYSAMGNPGRARKSLARALELGYRGRETIFAYADLAPDDARAAAYLEEHLANNPGDTKAAEYLITMYAKQPAEIIAVAERHIGALETLDDIAGALDAFEDRARAYLELGREGGEDAVTDAVEAHVLAGEDGRALDFAEGVWDEYGAAPGSPVSKAAFVDLLSILETSADAGVRGRVAEWYSRLAQEEIMNMPAFDAAVLQDLATRLFILRPKEYGQVREYFEQRREDLSREPEELVGPLPDVFEEPELPRLGQDRILLVGGFPGVVKRLRRTLRNKFNAHSVGSIAPKWESNFSQKDVRDRVRNATIVVIITGCLAHSTEALVQAARGGGSDDSRFIYPRARGQTGILAAIMKHVESRRAAG